MSRWMFSVCLIVVAVWPLGLRATTFPATSQDKEAVENVLKTIRDDDPATLDAGEDALVKLGEPARRGLSLFLYDPATAHRGMLQVAAFRLAHPNANPRAALAKWLGDKLPKDLGQRPEAVAMPWTIGAPNLLPDAVFYRLTFRQFPVARIAPAPLGSQNLWAVDAAGTVTHFTTAAQLQAYFAAHLPAIEQAAQGKQAAAAWLTLAPEFVQDGMFQFALDAESLAWQLVDAQHSTATGRVSVGGGGRGSLTATLTFTNAKLTDVQEKQNLKPGVRPICQATKLLDPDPIVRRMAEQDIRVMGRACRPYLLEQRAKASPELQQAMDRMWEVILREDR